MCLHMSGRLLHLSQCRNYYHTYTHGQTDWSIEHDDNSAVSETRMYTSTQAPLRTYLRNNESEPVSFLLLKQIRNK